MKARRIGLAPLSVSDEIMQAALDFTEPFTSRQLDHKTGRVCGGWLKRQVAAGNLTATRGKDHGWTLYEWIN